MIHRTLFRCLVLVASAQAMAPVTTGVIGGTVVATDSGRPVRAADVTLTAVDGQLTRTTVTDDTGRFSFATLPAGAFTLAVSKAGYLDTAYGQTRPGTAAPGSEIPLRPGERVERITIGVSHGSAIAGVVTDDHGDPAIETSVRVLRWVTTAGRRSLEVAGEATTDERGMYRIGLLPGGDYVVRAVPSESSIEDLSKMARAAGGAAVERTATYAPVFYPGTTAASAAGVVTLGVNDERANIDLQIALVPRLRIAGQILGTDGRPASGARVQLIDRALPDASLFTLSSDVDADGRFVFDDVVPGDYAVVARTGDARRLKVSYTRAARPGDHTAFDLVMTVDAFTYEAAKVTYAPAWTSDARTTAPAGRTTAGSPAQPLWAGADVRVDGSGISDLVLTLQPGRSVSGSVVFDGANPPAQLDGVRVGLVSVGAPADQSREVTGTLDARGGFSIPDVMPGQYRLTVTGAPGRWTLKSAMLGGQDALDVRLDVAPDRDVAGVEVTLHDRATELAGVLSDAQGRPAPAATVIAFPSDPRYWMPESRRIQAMRPSRDGQFAFRGLPAGDYRLVAVTDAEPGQWFDPGFLRALAGSATAVTLGDAEKKTQNLKINR
jgi:hypothetical protein